MHVIRFSKFETLANAAIADFCMRQNSYAVILLIQKPVAISTPAVNLPNLIAHAESFSSFQRNSGILSLSVRTLKRRDQLREIVEEASAANNTLISFPF